MARQVGNKWIGDALVNNSRVRKTFKTYEEAAAFEQGQMLVKEGSVKAVFDKVADREWRGTKNERNAVSIKNWLVDYFGPSNPVTSISAAAIEDMKDYLRNEVGNANGTVNRKLACLSKCLDYAEIKDFISKKPQIAYLKEGEGRIRFLTPEEEGRIFDHLSRFMDGKYYYYAVFLLYTGCRVSEALNLQWQDVTMGPSPMVTFWNTKNGTFRSVPLVARAQAALQWSQGQGWIRPFALIDYNTFQRAWTRAKDAAGLRKDGQVVPHVLRHTCASRLVQRGADIYKVKKWLGHSNISVTERYAKLRVSDLEDTGKLLD